MSGQGRSEHLIDGPVGKIQLIFDQPSSVPKGVVMVFHPQPLLGGSPLHVVPVMLARKLSADGWIVVRPSFRGVGKTAGEHSEGIGETEDCLAVVSFIKDLFPGLPVAIVGFSFGAYVGARVACELQGTLLAVALLGLPVGAVPGKRFYEPLAIPEECLLMHGELDEMAPLSNLMRWAAPAHRSVVVFAGADHFFKGCLNNAVEEVVAYFRRKSGAGSDGG